MCGIAGILRFNYHDEHLETQIKRMQIALQHRGPDDTGIYISSDQQAALAHTRLSILDLSSAGHQPMSTSDGRYSITFNGEIYNFQQLRQNLISQGETFYSQTDTEVILKLYQRMGSDCVHHLRGMFAFAIWDDLEKTCFLARDPLGIKPLYYWQSGRTLVFASELRAILASGLPKVDLNIDGLYGYLVTGSVPEPYTLIADIHCLAAGNWLYWQGGNASKKQYWQINFTPSDISPVEAQEIVQNALLDSIKNHFISDVPVGIFLSGGIDSTTVLALATKTQTEQLHTYSIAFAESEWNEGEISQKIADHFGAKHTEYKATLSFAKNLLPTFLGAIDQPSIDGFNTFCVSKIAHDSGMKVVLSGLGGDETFGGYQSFQKVPQMLKWSKQIQKFPSFSKSLGMGLAQWGNVPKMKRLGDFLYQPPSINSAYRSFRGIFSHTEACAIIQQWLGVSSNSNLPNFKNANFLTPEDEVSFLELSCYMRNQLLRDSDVMSMNWGLELRVPLVDKVLLETVASIPSQIRLAQGKKLLIQSVHELPEWVINRPKQGFFFPFEEWMSGEFGYCFPNMKIPHNIPVKPWYRRWSLGILKYWWEQVSA
ncbi:MULTISPECIES: asparagine synthase (glutamine-hydrolyzing) [Calothrix]|uniref:asparagine synthase (glutamine-hydrolyzing) n=2 Tax=Calothrix TaxID=1186 RepID=A0ABR8A347_9CYAN|nr:MULTISPECIES: asparagine synthase (glutamine-hydrolyzing) [Calothrix]MBD2193885.1 asparagine synthase (glutamine-hydrolyzing) [Calothrix parietina FACHB-288]MBD2222891.1 asparagine synthase (glutamine-hydrolyzing) [Calothrix anomala FACHB-343]